MNLSVFLKYIFLGFIAINFLLPTGLHAQALPKDPYADQYELITPPQPPTTGEGKVEVAEFFLYTCPHCYSFEDILNLWVEGKPSYVEFVKVPAVFNENQIGMAKIYYTAELLGVQTKINATVFKAIHQDHRHLNNELEMMQLFAENGVSNDDFRKTFHSFAVDMKVRQAGDMTSKYGISGVPAMAVQGKYRLSSGTAGGHTQLLKLIDYLAQKEYQLTAKTTPAETAPEHTSTPTPTATKTEAPDKAEASTEAQTSTPTATKTEATAETKTPTDTKEATEVKPASEASPKESPQTPATKESDSSKETIQTPAAKDSSESAAPAETTESSTAPKSVEAPPSSETKTAPQP